MERCEPVLLPSSEMVFEAHGVLSMLRGMRIIIQVQDHDLSYREACLRIAYLEENNAERFRAEALMLYYFRKDWHATVGVIQGQDNAKNMWDKAIVEQPQSVLVDCSRWWKQLVEFVNQTGQSDINRHTGQQSN